MSDNERCHSCAHWSREKISDWPNRDVPGRVGTCAVNGGQMNYWDSADEAQEKILDGYLGGENVYTHENFGCIHFKTTEG